MEKIKNPVLIKRNLVTGSLFLTSFEMLKTSVQDRIKSFLCYTSTLNEEGELVFDESEDYKTQVSERTIPHIDRRIYRDYHLFYSSCLWLKENHVITRVEFDEIQKIRKHRNLIVHEPLGLLVNDSISVNIALLKKSKELLMKIEKWWIIEFEIPTDPNFDGREIDESDVQSGSSVFLDYLLKIADDEINNNPLSRD